MIHLITGLPGAGKSLNALREIINERDYANRPVYYNNIKLLMIDFDVVHSFSGYFYGYWLPSLNADDSKKYQRVVLDIHKDSRLVEISDVPHLEQRFHAWLDASGAVSLWLKWVKKLYPDSIVQRLDNFLSINPNPTIDELKQFNLDWRKFDAVTAWYTLPHGSVILIDECQHWFPPRGHSAKVPEHVSHFETHRHHGFDVYLVTQNAKLLDNNIRRLAGRHVHYKNVFGTNTIIRYESSSVTDYDDYFGRKSADKRRVKRDKRYYGIYHSADIHTHKIRLPRKLYGAMLLMLFVVVLLVWLFLHFSSRVDAVSSDTDTDSVNDITSDLNEPVIHQPVIGSENHSKADYSFYPFDAINQIDNPLRNVCRRVTFAGTSTVATARRVSQSYYLQCIRSDVSHSRQPEPVQNTETVNESADTQSNQRPAAERDAYFLTTNYLSMLGFRLVLVDDVPVLAYENLRFVFPPL